MSIAVANRYARALADATSAKGDYRSILREMETFLEVYRASSELRAVFETPALAVARKIKVLEAVLQRLGTSAMTSNFFRVLASHYRMSLLGEICQSFRKITNDRLGIVQVKILSASSLTEEDRQALRRSLMELTRQQVEVEFHLDPDLAGGILAQIGSTVYDGSVRGSLQRIQRQLTAP